VSASDPEWTIFASRTVAHESPSGASLKLMKRQWTFVGLGIALVVACTLARSAEKGVGEIKRPGQWDANAVYLWPGPTDLADAPDGERLAIIRSPDQKVTLQVKDNRLIVLGQDGAAMAKPMDIEDLAEVSWAPDSKEFVVTQSDGGWVGSWTATVYAIDPGGLRKYAVSPLVAARFQTRKDGCDEIPNIAAGGWLSADAILIVAEAPPHSSCSDMGTIRGYALSLQDEQIKHEYSYAELRSRFGNRLGPRVVGQK
jgi:hypothetical protein